MITPDQLDRIVAAYRARMAGVTAVPAAEAAIIADVRHDQICTAAYNGRLPSAKSGVSYIVELAALFRWKAEGCPTEVVRQRHIG